MSPTIATSSLSELEETIKIALARKDGAAAMAACNAINQHFPDHAPGWHLSADVHRQLANYDRALDAIDTALQLRPQALDWQLLRARLLLSSGDRAGAIRQADSLSSQSLTVASLCSDLALIYSDLGLYQQALVQNQRAVSFRPDDAWLLYNQATLQRFLGEFRGAEASLNAALAKDSRLIDAYSLRSNLRKQTPAANHVEQLRALLTDSGLSPKGKVEISYALAKELDDLDDTEQSFYYLSLGARTRRQHMRYQVENDVGIMRSIEQVYSASRFGAAPSICANDEAIFILGLPRTGSTLLERILSSHSQIYSAGELNNFALQMTRLCHRAASENSAAAADLVGQSASLDFNQLGQTYIDSTRPQTGHTRHFIDKLPLNFLYTGLIHLALPKARIIHITRHPMDTCYAIFKQLFTNAYPFSYSLADIAEYYVAYRRLMAHWNTVLPNVIHTVRYEDLVADTESTSRAALEYCGLPFEPGCLQFYESKDAVTTASAAQVRQPVYAKSVGNWRRYEAQLLPLRERLEAARIACE